MKIKNWILFLLFFKSLSSYTQCDILIKTFENELYSSKALREYTAQVDNPDKVFDAWRILRQEDISLSRDLAKIKDIEKNLELVKKAGGYKKWQSLSDFFKNNHWSDTDIDLFLDSSNSVKTLENAQSWKLLKDADRTKLMNNPNAVEALTRVRANSQLQKLGFIDELLAKVKASKLEDGAFKDILNDLDNFGKALEKHPIEFDNFKNIISKLTDNNPQNSQAAQWIIQDITQNAKEFAGKKLSVEVKIRNSDKNLASIDVATNDVPPLTIEYKWLTSGIVSKDDFIREFIKRDLFNATDLSQIQWRIKGNKLSKEKVVEYLSSKEGREALNNKKIIQLFDGYAEKINYSKEITNINDILELLNKNNNWYNLIFK